MSNNDKMEGGTSCMDFESQNQCYVRSPFFLFETR